MGYRSDVAYIVAFHSEDKPEVAHVEYLKFKAWVNSYVVTHNSDSKLNPETTVSAEMFTDNKWCTFEWHDEDNMLSFYVSGYKWYDSYPEVQWHQELLNEAISTNTGAYRFARIGEDCSDVEVKEEGDYKLDLYEYVDVCRELRFDPPMKRQTTEA